MIDSVGWLKSRQTDGELMVIHPSLPTSAELIKESVIVAPCQLVTHRTTARLNTEQATESLEIEASLSFPKGHTSWPK